MLRVNGEGTFLGCKYGIAAMLSSGGGSIVNMSSVASATPTAMNAAYGFSKAGVAQFTRSEEHTSELQSLMRISYAVFCLKKKKSNQSKRAKQNQSTRTTLQTDNKY